MEYFLQQLINGLTLGAVYGLIAIGYTLVYGIIGMINFAHGEIYMIGAFIALIAFLILGPDGGGYLILALFTVLIVSMMLTAVYGWTLERLAYRPLRGSTRLAALISAIGMSDRAAELCPAHPGRAAPRRSSRSYRGASSSPSATGSRSRSATSR